MGIKGLKPLLRSNGITEKPVHISVLKEQIIAVDAAFLVHKCKNCVGVDWLEMLFNVFVTFKTYTVGAIFVFDGVAPPEKAREQALRQTRRKSTAQRALLLKEHLNDYVHQGVISVELAAAVIRLQNSPVEGRMLSGKLPKALLMDPERVLPVVTEPDERAKLYTIVKLREYVDRLLRDTKVYAEDYAVCKTIIQAFGFVALQAPSEAELYCVNLVKAGYAHTVLTTDSDAIASGAFHGLTVIYTDIYRETLQELDLKEMLRKLAIGTAQFMDLCVMCGTDFNQRIAKLGPATALKAIQTYGTLEHMAAKFPVASLQYLRTREILKGDRLSEPPPPQTEFNAQALEDLTELDKSLTRQATYRIGEARINDDASLFAIPLKSADGKRLETTLVRYRRSSAVVTSVARENLRLSCQLDG